MGTSPEEQILIEFRDEVTKIVENTLRKFFEKSVPVAPPTPVNCDTPRGTRIKHQDGRTGEVRSRDTQHSYMLWVRWDGDTTNSLFPVSVLTFLPEGVIKLMRVPPDMSNVNAQLERYGAALRNIVDFHPPGSATHKHAAAALDPEGKSHE